MRAFRRAVGAWKQTCLAASVGVVTGVVCFHAPTAHASPLLPHAIATSPTPRKATAASPAKWPTFTSDEVSVHDGSDAAGGSLWVTVGDAVLDVTGFVKDHPGGDFILDAAGGPVEGFWAYWAYHYHSSQVQDYIQQLRIGTLSDYDGDASNPKAWEDDVRSVYAGDEPCDASHLVMMERPRDTETYRWAMAPGLTTPNASFYIRNHCPVPASAGADHTIDFRSAVNRDQQENTLTLAEMQKRFEQVDVTSVMQCCGNRAAEMIARNKPTSFTGTPYEHIDVGMMGNAKWTGYRLADVLPALFPWLKTASEAKLARLHVHFISLDGYSTSTPLLRLLDASNGALLATGMNGEPLPPHHGAPVRAVLPGIGGARNVKWVNRVEVHDHPCPSCWTRRFYKDTRQSPTPPSIQELPMQSMLLSWAPNQVVSLERETAGNGVLPVSGIAWGGASGRPIKRVEVSLDGGRTWQDVTLRSDELPAPLPRGDDAKHAKQWSWVRWHGDIPLPDAVAKEGGEVTVVCRATDSAGQQQPDNMFVPSGYLYNGYHHTKLRLKA